MNFLYFVPGGERGTDPAEAGLGYAFEGIQHVVRMVTGNGPGGGSGAIMGTESAGLGYYKDRQRWIPHPSASHNGKPCWVGAESLPTPAELQRGQQLSGEMITLNDERDWLIPLIRFYVEPDEATDNPGGFGIALPRVMGVDEVAAARGEFKMEWGTVDRRFSHLTDLAARYYEWFASDKESDIPEDIAAKLTTWATQVVSANYRIDLPEAVLLNLFDSQTDCAQRVLNYAAIDWGNLGEWLKKNAEQADDGLSIQHGLEDERCQDTSQLTPITSPSA